MSGYRPLSFTVDGLRDFLHGLNRRVTDLERSGSWKFDRDNTTDEGSLAGLLPRTILDYGAPDWRYKVIARTDTTDYSAQAFDDSAWSVGTATFGATNAPGLLPRAITTTTSLDVATWLRRTIPGSLNSVRVTVMADNVGEAWWNGTYLGSFNLGAGNVSNDENEFVVPQSAVDPTSNVLAIRVVDDAASPSDHHYADAQVVAATAGIALDDLSDVDTTTVAPTSGDALVFDSASGLWGPGGVSAGSAAEILHVRDEKASGTGPASPSAGTWQTRTLNTVKLNDISGASLAANQITLPAGTYEVHALATAGGSVQHHRARLRNVTAGVTLALSINHYTNNISGTPVTGHAIVSGRFVLGSSSAVELQHYASGGSGNFGFASSTGEVEVYADVFIHKLA